jgi:hypothetical protein
MAITEDPKPDDAVSYMDVEEAARESLSVHWRAVFAGLFISMLVYFTLVALGVGIGANQAIDVIQGEDKASSLGMGAGIWLAVTVLISLIVGSYASSRVSGIIATRVGYVQGAVIAALFFTLMISQLGMAVGMLGRGVGALSSTVGGTARDMVASPQVTGIVEDALADLNFKSDPQTVITGFLARILRGDENSAVNYLSAQTGISRDEATTRYQNLKDQVRTTAASVGEDSARVARTA